MLLKKKKMPKLEIRKCTWDSNKNINISKNVKSSILIRYWESSVPFHHIAKNLLEFRIVIYYV